MPGDEFVAKGIANMEAYDTQCESVPPALKQMMDTALKTVSSEALQAAMKDVLSRFKSDGRDKFCATIKPAVERAIARQELN
jgi:hypothetical protein